MQLRDEVLTPVDAACRQDRHRRSPTVTTWQRVSVQLHHLPSLLSRSSGACLSGKRQSTAPRRPKQGKNLPRCFKSWTWADSVSRGAACHKGRCVPIPGRRAVDLRSGRLPRVSVCRLPRATRAPGTALRHPKSYGNWLVHGQAEQFNERVTVKTQGWQTTVRVEHGPRAPLRNPCLGSELADGLLRLATFDGLALGAFLGSVLFQPGSSLLPESVRFLFIATLPCDGRVYLLPPECLSGSGHLNPRHVPAGNLRLLPVPSPVILSAMPPDAKQATRQIVWVTLPHTALAAVGQEVQHPRYAPPAGLRLRLAPNC